MKQFLFLLTLLCLIAGALIAVANRDRSKWSAPREGLIRGTGANLAFISQDKDRIAILLPGSCVHQTSRSASTVSNRSFSVDSDYFGDDGGPKVRVQYNSESPYEIKINGRSFSLTEGRVFCVKTESDSGQIKRIFQTPFKPLEPSAEYLENLQSQLSP